MMFRTELALWLRQPLVWIAIILQPAFAFLLAIGTHRDEVIASQQLQMVEMTMLMLSMPIMFGALAPISFLRDQSSNMHELINVTPIPVARRYLTRAGVIAAFATTMIVLSIATLSLVVVNKLDVDYSFFGNSLLLFSLLGIPSVVFLSALALWVCRGFNSRPVLYVVFALIWLGYMTLASMTGSPMMAGSSVVSEDLLLAMRLLDPYGITPVVVQFQQGSTGFAIDGYLIFNRALYLSLAVVLCYRAVNKTFTDKAPDSKARTENEPAKTTETQRTFTSITPVINNYASIKQVASFHLSGLLRDHLTKLLLLGWTLLIFSESLAGIEFAEARSIIVPTSIDAFNRVAWDVVPIMGTGLLLLWSWQVCWRSKLSGFAELVSASPIPSLSLAFGQYLSLLGILMITTLLIGAGVFGAEVFADSQIMPTHYLTQLAFSFVQMALIAALLIAIHTLCSSQMMAAGIILLMLLVKMSPLTGILNIPHPLWNIAGTPLEAPDLFWGFAGSLSTYLPFTLFWLVCISAIFLWAAHYSHRGAAINPAVSHKVTAPLLVMTLLSISGGLYLHHSIKTERPIMSVSERAKWRANYEKHYKHWSDAAQPSVSALKTQLDIYPDDGFAVFDVSMTLTNHTKQPIKTVLVGGYGAVRYSSIKMKGAALIEHDVPINQYIFALDKPLMPGDNTELRVNITHQRRKLWPAKPHHIIRPQFTYLRGVPMLPKVGFYQGYQLRDNASRLEYGLAEFEQQRPSALFADDLPLNERYDWATLHSVISTQPGHRAITQGELVNEWQENNRHYFEYKTKGPIRNLPAWFSVPYQAVSAQADSIELNVFAKTLGEGTDINLLGMKDTVKWFNQNIKPYNGKRLSMIAIPYIGPTGYALPQLMLINHKVGFRAFPSEQAGFDQRYRRAVHETAHQWFGHDIGNGVLSDRAFLVESLAKYVELVMIENRFGEAAKNALVDYERSRYRYARAKSTGPTEALVDAAENFDQYSRATLVFDKLRTELGDEIIIRSLRGLWQTHGYPAAPATAMDFVRAMQLQATDEQKVIIEQLLLGTDISLWLQNSQ